MLLPAFCQNIVNYKYGERLSVKQGTGNRERNKERNVERENPEHEMPECVKPGTRKAK